MNSEFDMRRLSRRFGPPVVDVDPVDFWSEVWVSACYAGALIWGSFTVGFVLAWMIAR